jgi:hypothetical protein
METTTLQQKRRRIALLVLPLPVICFATLLFHVLGGGAAAAAGNPSRQTGLNKQLPDAQLKKGPPLNKLAYYNQASADSAKERQLRLNDPYAGIKADTAPASRSAASGFSPHPPELATNGSAQANAQKIGERLQTLQQLINEPEKPATAAKRETTAAASPGLRVPPGSEDPELKQMNGLLEKILDIQHPERVQQKAAESVPALTAHFRAIPAVVDGTQKIVSGTVIRLRLLDSARFKDHFFPKGTLIYGSGELYNQRYRVTIKLIRQGNEIMPVDLTVYDQVDSQEGISVPEAVTGDAVKDGAVSGLQNMDLMSYAPSVKAQLTTTGINTAKGLFSKKIKRVKGKIKNGHEVLLRDNLLAKRRPQ